MELTQDKIAELEGRHGELLILKGKPRNGGDSPWTIALKRADRASYKMFRARVAKQDPDAQEGLVVGLTVWPERQDMVALLDRYPAIPEAISEPLLEWVLGKAEEAGKG